MCKKWDQVQTQPCLHNPSPDTPLSIMNYSIIPSHTNNIYNNDNYHYWKIKCNYNYKCFNGVVSFMLHVYYIVKQLCTTIIDRNKHRNKFLTPTYPPLMKKIINSNICTWDLYWRRNSTIDIFSYTLKKKSTLHSTHH